MVFPIKRSALFLAFASQSHNCTRATGANLLRWGVMNGSTVEGLVQSPPIAEGQNYLSLEKNKKENRFNDLP